MDVLERASGGEPIDRDAVERSLLEVVHAVGLGMDGSEASRHWHEFAAREPSLRQERDAFLELAEAEDPFELAQSNRKYPGLLNSSAALRRVTQRLSRTRNSQAPIWQGFWGNLSPEEQSQVRESLRSAAHYRGSFIKKGRVQKTHLDTALLELADLYLSWTRQTIARHQLPYALESRFIQFAVATLEPVGQYFEVSGQALSRRWERIVLHERTGDPALDEAAPEPTPEEQP